MNSFFSPYYTGAPFRHFALAHLVALVCVAGMCLLIVVLLRDGERPRLRESFRWGLAGFAVLNGLAWQLWNIWAGIWSPAYTLPVHICTLSNFLCPILLLRPGRALYEVLYFWGWAGVTQALLTPDIGIYGFPHFVFIIFFTSHGVTLACVVFSTVADKLRPTWASIGRVTLITFGYLGVVGIINWLTGGNYMFVAHKPAFPSLIDYLGPWPWYVFGLVAVGVVAFVICYLPFAIYDRLKAEG